MSMKIIGFKTSVTLPIDLIPEEYHYIHRKMEDYPHTTAVVRLCRVVGTFNIGDQGYHLVSNFSKDTYAIVEFEAIVSIPYKFINKVKCSAFYYRGQKAELMYSFMNLKEVGFHSIRYRAEYFGPLLTTIARDDELIGVDLNDHWINQAQLHAIHLNWNEAQDFALLINHFNTYKNCENEPK